MFFAASTRRWALLSSALSDKSMLCVKRMSDTWWSARAVVLKALHSGYSEIVDGIAGDQTQ